MVQSMEFSRPEHLSGKPFRSPGDLPNLGIEPRSSALQVDSLPAESQGKPKNTGVGSLSLLWWISLTQGSNLGLLHCRWILYQLSYEGSPNINIEWKKCHLPPSFPCPGLQQGLREACRQIPLQINSVHNESGLVLLDVLWIKGGNGAACPDNRREVKTDGLEAA